VVEQQCTSLLNQRQFESPGDSSRMWLTSCEEASSGHLAARWGHGQQGCGAISVVTAEQYHASRGRYSGQQRPAYMHYHVSRPSYVRAAGTTWACVLALLAGGGLRVQVGQAALQTGRAAWVRPLGPRGRPFQRTRRLAQLPDADAFVSRRLLQQPPRSEGPGICHPIRPSQRQLYGQVWVLFLARDD